MLGGTRPRILQTPPPQPSPPDSLQRREAGVLDHGAGGEPEGVGCPQEVGGDGGAPRLLLREGGLRDETLAAAAAAAASRPRFLLEGEEAETPSRALGAGRDPERNGGVPAVSPPGDARRAPSVPTAPLPGTGTQGGMRLPEHPPAPRLGGREGPGGLWRGHRRDRGC